MAGTVHTEAYKVLMRTLMDLRKGQDLSQAALAKRLGKPPSFVGKYELGERRLDVVETLVILNALGGDPIDTLTGVLDKIPAQLKFRD